MNDPALKNEYEEDRIRRAARLFQIMDRVTLNSEDASNIDMPYWIDLVKSLMHGTPHEYDNLVKRARYEILEIIGLRSVRGERHS